VVAAGNEALHRVLQMHARSARARLLSHGTRNGSLECSSNVRIVAHFCMVGRQTSSHAKGIYHSEQRAICAFRWQKIVCNPLFLPPSFSGFQAEMDCPSLHA